MSGGTDGEALAARALERLRARTEPRRRPFTCDLSVDELVMVEHAGLEPLQLVMGSCMVSVARRRRSRSASWGTRRRRCTRPGTAPSRSCGTRRASSARTG